MVNLGDVFQGADDQEKRQLMMFLGSNWYLSNKKVALTPREPLSELRHNSESPNWRARPDERTMIDQLSLFHYIRSAGQTTLGLTWPESPTQIRQPASN